VIKVSTREVVMVVLEWEVGFGEPNRPCCISLGLKKRLIPGRPYQDRAPVIYEGQSFLLPLLPLLRRQPHAHMLLPRSHRLLPRSPPTGSRVGQDDYVAYLELSVEL
jgi:hypothetical protein